MILAEKIMQLRKKNGWSQEELAGKLNISRQSVSKWESAMSVPDLEKILQLSQIFEVSTDYLLKDDRVEEEFVPGNPDGMKLRKVTMEEAQEFIRAREDASVKIAAGVSACVLSPTALILLSGAAAYQKISLSEELACGIGITILLILVAGAVAAFIMNGIKLGKYEFLENEEFELSYGIEGMVREKSEILNGPFTIRVAIGVALCILGAIPLILAEGIWGTGMAVICSVVFLLFMVASAVFLFVNVGMKKGAYDQLLQVGDYTPSQKKANKLVGKIASVYWCVVTAAYVGYSLWTNRWETSWIVWPVAGILFGAIAGFIHLSQKE